jgi:polyisoprenoid-binding protein YceI
MKRIYYAVVLLSLATCQKPPAAPSAAISEPYEIPTTIGNSLRLNSDQSQLSWIGTKRVGSHTGKIALKTGTIVVASGRIVGGNFTIDMDKISVDDLQGEKQGKLIRHLKHDDFFSVARFPEAQFQIARVEVLGPGKFLVQGNLTLKGITRGVSFEANISDTRKMPITATSEFNLDRTQWGVVYTGMKDNLLDKMINLKLYLTTSG